MAFVDNFRFASFDNDRMQIWIDYDNETMIVSQVRYWNQTNRNWTAQIGNRLFTLEAGRDVTVDIPPPQRPNLLDMPFVAVY